MPRETTATRPTEPTEPKEGEKAVVTDTTSKALNLATKICAQADALMNSVRLLDALTQEHSGSGIDFAGMDFSGTTLKHVTGDDVNLVLSSAAATKTWLEEQFHDDNFDKVRP